MNIGEANRVRACLDCGEPGALLWRTTKGENVGRLLRICAACLRKDDWHVFGLVERQPILGEVPMGDAPTYEDAKRKAETWIQARINGMPASGRWA